MQKVIDTTKGKCPSPWKPEGEFLYLGFLREVLPFGETAMRGGNWRDWKVESQMKV